MSPDGSEHGHSHGPAGGDDHGHGHSHGGEHGHSHGLVARSILRSRAGLRAVSWSLGVLLVTALLQALVFVLTGSVALLADLIHNFGDALTAVPLGIAFLLRSFTAEKRAGLFVVLAIFISACVAFGEAINRLVHPQSISHLGVLAAAGVVGFVGNEIAAQVRLGAGRRLQSPALIADGYHARTDGFVSLAVVASAIVVALGIQIADPIIGLVISLVILRITWQSFRTVQADPGPGEFDDRDGEQDHGEHEHGDHGEHEHGDHGHSHGAAVIAAMSPAGLIAPAVLGRDRPATVANIARNGAGANGARAERWASAREAAWRVLDRHVPQSARVAVIGAGNGDDLPLVNLAGRTSQLDLFDLDAAALRRARRACPSGLRGRVRLHRVDVTAGAADRITRAVRRGRQPSACEVPGRPVGRGGYDVVVGDLFYSQLLYPALLDAGLAGAATRRALAEYGPPLTDAVLARMRASAAPGAPVIHLHDAVGWWDGHPQPVSLPEILSQPTPGEAGALIARCRQPCGTDPDDSARRLGARVLETALWEWPFAPGVSYLVRATVTSDQLV